MEANKNIADKTEGLHTIVISDYNPVVAEPSLKKIISIGNATFKNCVVQLPTPNCYIFCLSINKNENIT